MRKRMIFDGSSRFLTFRMALSKVTRYAAALLKKAVVPVDWLHSEKPVSFDCRFGQDQEKLKLERQMTITRMHYNSLCMDAKAFILTDEHLYLVQMTVVDVP